jgi:putative transposase
MGQKRYTPEQIIGMLRQTEVRSAEGATVAEIVRELGITDSIAWLTRRSE